MLTQSPGLAGSVCALDLVGNVGVWDQRARISSRSHFIKEKCRNLVGYDTHCGERGKCTIPIYLVVLQMSI